MKTPPFFFRGDQLSGAQPSRSAAGHRAEQRRLEGEQARLRPERVTATIAPALDIVDRIRAVPATCRATLEQIATQKRHATRARRIFEYERGIERPVRRPDRMQTALIAGGCIALEGGLSGILFIADGHFTVLTGMATGYAIATINVLAAMVTGYFPGRYAGYKLQGRRISRADRFKRHMGRIGLVAGAGALGLLHYGAARMRGTGAADELFTFHQTGALATINDYFSVALLVLGGAASLIGFMKGRHGISDPVPGYNAIVEDCETLTEAATEAIITGSVERIEVLNTEALKRLEHAEDGLRAFRDQQQAAIESCTAQVLAHHHARDAEREALESANAWERDYRRFVEQTEPPVTEAAAPTPSDDTSLPVTPDTGAADQAVAAAQAEIDYARMTLRDAVQEAMQAITAAHCQSLRQQAYAIPLPLHLHPHDSKED